MCIDLSVEKSVSLSSKKRSELYKWRKWIDKNKLFQFFAEKVYACIDCTSVTDYSRSKVVIGQIFRI